MLICGECDARVEGHSKAGRLMLRCGEHGRLVRSDQECTVSLERLVRRHDAIGREIAKRRGVADPAAEEASLCEAVGGDRLPGMDGVSDDWDAGE